jgi:hypothetical protein
LALFVDDKYIEFCEGKCEPELKERLTNGNHEQVGVQTGECFVGRRLWAD